jgi:hypothetical protein
LTTQAIELFRSVPRYLTARAVGGRLPGLLSGPLATVIQDLLSIGDIGVARQVVDAVDDEPVPQDAFFVGAKFLGYLLARFVAERRENFNTIEQELFESKLGCQAGGSSCKATTRPRRPQPITQICQPMLRL